MNAIEMVCPFSGPISERYSDERSNHVAIPTIFFLAPLRLCVRPFSLNFRIKEYCFCFNPGSFSPGGSAGFRIKSGMTKSNFLRDHQIWNLCAGALCITDRSSFQLAVSINHCVLTTVALPSPFAGIHPPGMPRSSRWPIGNRSGPDPVVF